MGFSFFLGVTLFAGAVLFFVLQPLLSGKRAPMGPSDAEMTDAEQKRRVSLLALRDVEYDRVTGKLDDKDYNDLKREISAEALAALAAEEAERKELATGTPAVRGNVIDFEAELRRVRSGLRAGTTCRSCGHVNPSGSRFCSSCGSPLASGTPTGAGKSG
jgi:cytochrome c-type biogenesis protein CcmI